MADKRQKRAAEFIEPFRVKPGSKVTLAKDFDPRFKAGVKKKKEGVALLKKGVRLLSEYQARLAAQDKWGVLVVLQALDAAGKDGTIRHVMSGVNPQGVKVHSFKVPSSEELDHDLPVALRAAPAGARRDRDLQPLALRGGPRRPRAPREPRAPEDPRAVQEGGRVQAALREINDWERYLTENGFRIVKLFLNLSKEEQRTRFLRRIDLPDHNWKFSAADVKEREFWDDYQKAFSEMLSHTSTEWAPWYVIPADRKWFGRIGAGAVLVHALMEIDPRFPVVTEATA